LTLAKYASASSTFNLPCCCGSSAADPDDAAAGAAGAEAAPPSPPVEVAGAGSAEVLPLALPDVAAVPSAPVSFTAGAPGAGTPTPSTAAPEASVAAGVCPVVGWVVAFPVLSEESVAETDTEEIEAAEANALDAPWEVAAAASLPKAALPSVPVVGVGWVAELAELAELETSLAVVDPFVPSTAAFFTAGPDEVVASSPSASSRLRFIGGFGCLVQIVCDCD
jgi:hypothetical protein